MGDGSLGDGMRECERFGDGQNCGGMKIFLRRRAAKSFTRKSLGLGLQARKERVVKGGKNASCLRGREIGELLACWLGGQPRRPIFLLAVDFKVCPPSCVAGKEMDLEAYGQASPASEHKRNTVEIGRPREGVGATNPKEWWAIITLCSRGASDMSLDALRA